MKGKFIFILGLIAVKGFADDVIIHSPAEIIIETIEEDAWFQERKHHFAPTFFFERHKEGAYRYHIYGLSLQYLYKKPEGFNFKGVVSSNIDSNYLYFKEIIEPSYIFFGNEKISYFPFVGIKNTTHEIGKFDKSDVFVAKGSVYTGLGLKPTIWANQDLYLKFGLSKDLYNTILQTGKTSFKGSKFSNPFGYLLDIYYYIAPTNSLAFSLEGAYARSWGDEFINFGYALNAMWRF